MGALQTVPFGLRTFEKTENDYSGVAQVITAVWPDDPTTANELEREDDAREPGLVSRRIVAERDGRIIAFGVYGQAEASRRPREFYLNALVHPDHRRRGVGQALYGHISGLLARHRPALLTADTRESQPDAVGFLIRRGFEVIQRRPVLRLDVKSFDSARLPSGTMHSKARNITVSALSELMASVLDWKRRCWELDWDIVQDIPSPDAPVRPTLESFARCFEEPTFTPQSWFIALHGDEWVGMSTIDSDPATPGTFYTGVTGVRRRYRRKGIATALKLRGIEHVRAQGGQFLETDNEENNPILKLNLALGFEPGPAILEFQKTF